MEEIIVKDISQKETKLYKIRFENRSKYLYVYVEGEKNRYEIGKKYWLEVLAECRKNNHQKVLVEENIGENTSASEMYEIATKVSNLGFGNILLAFVDCQPDHHSLNRFGELVATNRGLKAKVFNNFTEAEQWLLMN